MRRIYISSMYRLYEGGVGKGELGYVYVLDWDTKELLVEPKGVEPDYSLYTPMGKSHGCRGITIHEGKLYVASSGHDISVFDLDTYRLINKLSFPDFKHIHQIKDHNGILYVCSTGTDRLYKLKNDQVIEEIYLGSIAPIVDPFIPEDWHGTWGNDRLHFNSIGWDSYGDEYHIYFGARMVFNFTKCKIVYAHGVLRCPHDIMFIPGNAFLVGSSQDKSVYLFLATLDEIRCINKSFDVAPPDIPNDHGFTHGLASGSNLVFSCSSPTQIRSFDSKTFKLLETHRLTENPNECIYDLVLDPRDWNTNET